MGFHVGPKNKLYQRLVEFISSDKDLMNVFQQFKFRITVEKPLQFYRIQI